SPSMVPVAAGTARRPTSPFGRSTTLSGVSPPTARPTRCASATPSARRRRTVRASRSGIGPRGSRSARVSPSIHSLTTYAAPAGAPHPGRDRSSAPSPSPQGCQGFPDLGDTGDYETRESHAAGHYGTEHHGDERPCGARADEVVGHVPDEQAHAGGDRRSGG